MSFKTPFYTEKKRVMTLLHENVAFLKEQLIQKVKSSILN